MKRTIVMFTHNDLDGVFCGVLANITFSDDTKVIIYYCGYNDIDEKVTKFIKEDLDNIEGEVIVYITDISVTEDTALLIEEAHQPKADGALAHFWLLDHHVNSHTEKLNQYEWALVRGTTVINGVEKKTCGTRLFFDHMDLLLEMKLSDIQYKNLEKTVELVRKYDTWEWAETNELEPDQLNTLFRFFSRKNFIKRYSDILKYDSQEIFDEVDKIILEEDALNKEACIKAKMKEVFFKTIDGKCAGIVISENYINDVAHAITDQFSQADFALVVTSKSLSFRTNKDNINVAKIAEKFGGNGHPKAAGARIDDDSREDVLSDLLFILQDKQQG